MRLISKGYTLSLQGRYDWLIRTFAEEVLGSESHRLQKVSVYAVRGNTRCPAGKVYIGREGRNVITLYKAGIDMAHLFRERRIAYCGDGKTAFNTFVFLHEVAHIIQVVRDWERYRPFVESTQVFHGVEGEAGAWEREADEMAAAFIRRHRLFPIELVADENNLHQQAA